MILFGPRQQNKEIMGRHCKLANFSFISGKTFKIFQGLKNEMVSGGSRFPFLGDLQAQTGLLPLRYVI